METCLLATALFFFRYMSEVVCLQRPVGTEWIYEKIQPSPPCPPKHCSPGPPVLQLQPQPQPQPSLTAQKRTSGSGEVAIVLQEVRNQEGMSPGGGTGPEAGARRAWCRLLNLEGPWMRVVTDLPLEHSDPSPPPKKKRKERIPNLLWTWASH